MIFRKDFKLSITQYLIEIYNKLLLQGMISFIVFIYIFLITLVVIFDSNTTTLQFLSVFSFLPKLWKYSIFFAIDGFNILFISLTAIILLCCYRWYKITAYNEITVFIKISLFIIFLLTSLAFLTIDFFLFFCLFEILLVPMFFIFSKMSLRNRSKKAVVYFYLYTILGSIFILLGIFILFSNTGTLNYLYLKEFWFSFNKQLLLLLIMLPGFSTKIPIYPVHLWLPEAHVEATTIGSVILAALLLKLGCFGFLRYVLINCQFAILYLGPIVLYISIISAIAGSISAIRQIDLKKLIAYSSINHMGLVLAGMSIFNIYALEGAIHLMLSHGIVSAGLFFCIGILYEKFHTKLFLYYTGLIQIVPITILFIFIFMQGNIAFPGTWSFVSELLIFMGLIQTSLLITIGFKFPVFINTLYSILIFTKLSFGSYKQPTKYLYFINDISLKKIYILSYLAFILILFGIYPNTILNITFFYTKAFLVG